MPAQLKICYPDKPAAELMLWESEQYRLGRAQENEIVIDHQSVSRHHAQLRFEDSHWYLEDLQSSNGTIVDGLRVKRLPLSSRHYLNFGALHGRFEIFEQAQASQWHSHHEWRNQQATRLLEQITVNRRLNELIDLALASLLQASQTERGLILLGDHIENLQLVSHLGMKEKGFRLPDFTGSRSAIERAIKLKSSIVSCDALEHDFLGKKQSVLKKNIRALVCVPLVCNDKLLGVAYCDSHQPDKFVTELDLAILERLCHHIAVTVMAAQVQAELTALYSVAALGETTVMPWSELIS